MAQVAQIETLINAAQEVIYRDVIFNVERVQQPFLSTRQLSHHAANPPAGRCPYFAAGQAGDLLFQQNQPIAVGGQSNGKLITSIRTLNLVADKLSISHAAVVPPNVPFHLESEL
jgi:hypothetical protein